MTVIVTEKAYVVLFCFKYKHITRQSSQNDKNNLFL